MFSKKDTAAQPEFWVATQNLPKTAKNTFYTRLEETLQSFGFAEKVHQLCVPAYKQSGTGRPGIDPVVYLKMLMIGFFENLPSERAIASRCADSIAIRQFLKYGLEENTPDHSSLTVIRQRLGMQIFEALFTLTLEALQSHGLLRGKNLGLDSSVIEANAALRSLINRNTKEEYWNYVKRLAAEAGIDPEDPQAVRRFDRNRPGKGSNKELENPHDPDAKIGRTKHGATDMIYKPETVVDLDTGAIVQAEVHAGDQPDNHDLGAKALEAQQTINQVQDAPLDRLTVENVVADKGYYNVEELAVLQAEGIKTVISDPATNRKLENLRGQERKTVLAALRSVKSKKGKALLARRGMHIERAFAHILDSGGLRRTTLRGWENLNKRFKLGAAFYNLSQLMRKLFGFGTPKQLEALKGAFFFWFVAGLWTLEPLLNLTETREEFADKENPMPRRRLQKFGFFGFLERAAFSTGC